MTHSNLKISLKAHLAAKNNRFSLTNQVRNLKKVPVVKLLNYLSPFYQAKSNTYGQMTTHLYMKPAIPNTLFLLRQVPPEKTSN